jgi:hypothetical protein
MRLCCLVILPKKNSLRIESERSRHYSIAEEGQVDCDFSFVLPPKNRPWMVLVHVACTISVPVKPGPRYHGMKVVKAVRVRIWLTLRGN